MFIKSKVIIKIFKNKILSKKKEGGYYNVFILYYVFRKMLQRDNIDVEIY